MDKIWEFVVALLKTVGAPSAAMKVVAAVLLFALAMKGLLKALEWVGDIRQVWNDRIKPMFYDAAKKRRVDMRQQFADHVEGEIRRLDRQEDWRDHRFAELEAEVEAEIHARRLPWKRDGGIDRRRERSLSKALARTRERLILLEGEPGAGKSVALRHVARQMALKAMKDPSVTAVIPLYINLKGLERKTGETVDAALIRAYVIDFLTKVNSRHVTEILNTEFDAGLAEGSWLFLFDSFDEIPEVLSSTEADSIVRDYAEAIAGFLRGGNTCHGVIASRQFRGPKSLDWPRFRITALSREAQRDLIGRADLGELTSMTIGQLHTTQSEIAAVARTPLFLGLVCEYVREHKQFPESAHSVFESYVDSRLRRDTEQLKKRFDLKAARIREAAEQIAFAMAADDGLGLSVKRGAIRAAMAKNGRAALATDKILDALEYIKLARADNDEHGDARTFTFAHRRFQEYFATCVVLRDAEIVPDRELLLNARWRETAVVIFQTQTGSTVDELVTTAATLLDEIVTQLRATTSTLTDPPAKDDDDPPPSHFPWPPRALHLLGLLQSGFNATRTAALPMPMRAAAAEIVLTAAWTGSLADLRSAVDVAGVVPQEAMLWTIRRAFATKSRWVIEVAYLQVARLTPMPEDVSHLINTELLRLARTWEMEKEKDRTYAQVSRMHDPSRFLASLHMLRTIRWVEPVLLTLAMLVAGYVMWGMTRNVVWTLPAMVITAALLWYFARFFVGSVDPVIPVTTEFMNGNFGPLAPVVEKSLGAMSLMLRGTVLLAAMVSLLDDSELQISLPTIGSILGKNSPMLRGGISLSTSRTILATALFVMLLLLSWTLVALRMVRMGAVPRPVLYPFIHFIGLGRFLRTVAGTIRGEVRKFVEEPLVNLAAIGFIGVMLAVVVGGGYLVKQLLGEWFERAIFGFFAVVGLPLVVAGLVLLIAERRRLAAFRRRRSERFASATDLVEVLRTFRTCDFRLTVIRDVRERHLVLPSADNESVLRDAALAVETKTRADSADTFINVAGEMVVLTILRQQPQPTLGSGLELAEELHRLADTLQSQRGGGN